MTLIKEKRWGKGGGGGLEVVMSFTEMPDANVGVNRGYYMAARRYYC